jgi:hypothetical protein
MALTLEASVTVHGAASRPAATVAVSIVPQPIGTPLFVPAATRTVIEDSNATPGTRARSARAFAG